LTTGIQISSAQQGATITVNLQLAVNPNPTGVDQTVDVIIWGQPIPPGSGEVFSDFTVTITKPGGTTQTLGPVDSWPIGAQVLRYTPTEVGDYTFRLNYPGDYFASEDQTYLGGQSPETTLTVQEDYVQGMPTTPLPEYIDGIVNTENREWSGIVGSWMMTYYDSTYTGYGDSGGGYNPYSTAPRSPHIRWAIPAGMGGLPGGDLVSDGVYSGLSYSSYGNPPIVMHNRLYVNTNPTLGHFRSTSGEGIACYDLQTGEELWRREGAGITHGQHYRSYSPSRTGVFSFLWDLNEANNRWEVYDPFDGSLEMVFENVTKDGTQWWWEDAVMYGPNGDLYVYILDGYASELTMWNSTKAFWGNGIHRIGGDGVERFGWSTQGFASETEISTLYDWEKGIEWTVTLDPDRIVGWHPPYSIFGISDGVIIAKTGTAGNWIDWEMGYDLETGRELWAADITQSVQSFYSSVGEGVAAAFDLTTRTWTGKNIQTGAKLWTTEPAEYPWGTYGSYGSTIAEGQLFHGNFDGHLYAYDIETGATNWKFYSGDSGTETVMGTWPIWYGPLVADGVVFCGTGEETPTQPLTRGNRVFAVDTETGEEIWHIAGYMSLKAVAEGVLIGYNGYDSQIYCFGKGPSATTVTAPKTEVTHGQKLVIEGTVTDQSAGAMGTPAISDEDMGDWMEYIYMQKPFPGNAKGVDVSIDVIDANGNFRNVGTATSDTSGTYSLVWEPDIPGQYSVIATFAGSESYASSFATTSFYVEEAPQPTAVPDPTPAPMTDTYVLGMGVAAIAAIVVIGLLILMKVGKK
jgi:outer membrane protein assembly factor BamB